MTFSLTARCPRTGELGIAISSSSPAVAARCVHLRSGVGAAVSQNITDPRLGPLLLDHLAAGFDATGALATVVAEDPTSDYRQLAVVDAAGGFAAHSGPRTLGVYHTAGDEGTVAAGNLLAAPDVVDRMLEGYLRSPYDDLVDRLFDGLEAALRAGGEAGRVHSAGVEVMHPTAGWSSTDLRVDWHDDPIGQLRQLWDRWQPERDDYIRRGLDPSSAPAYGVPGDP